MKRKKKKKSIHQYFSFQFHNGVSIFVSENQKQLSKRRCNKDNRISKFLIQQEFKIPCYCLPVPTIHCIPIPN